MSIARLVCANVNLSSKLSSATNTRCIQRVSPTHKDGAVGGEGILPELSPPAQSRKKLDSSFQTDPDSQIPSHRSKHRMSSEHPGLGEGVPAHGRDELDELSGPSSPGHFMIL